MSSNQHHLLHEKLPFLVWTLQGFTVQQSRTHIKTQLDPGAPFIITYGHAAIGQSKSRKSSLAWTVRIAKGQLILHCCIKFDGFEPFALPALTIIVHLQNAHLSEEEPNVNTR